MEQIIERGAKPAPQPAAGECELRDLLREFVGKYIQSEHLVGTNELAVKEGILQRVEKNCYLLHHEESGCDELCDYYSLKFVRAWPGTPPQQTRQAIRQQTWRRPSQ